MDAGKLSSDRIFAVLAGIIEGEEKPSAVDLRKVLPDAYAKMVENLGPILRATPSLSGPVSKDLAPVVCALMDVGSNVGNSAAFGEAHGKIAKARAAARMRSLKAYKAAGFSSTQAFQLVLQDASQKFTPPKIETSQSKG